MLLSRWLKAVVEGGGERPEPVKRLKPVAADEEAGEAFGGPPSDTKPSMSRSFLPSLFDHVLGDVGVGMQLEHVVVGRVALESSLQGADRVTAAKTFEPSAVLRRGRPM